MRALGVEATGSTSGVRKRISRGCVHGGSNEFVVPFSDSLLWGGFFVESCGVIRDQHFFPTRRSSNLLYAKMEGWSEDVVGGSGLRIELIGEKPVVGKADSSDPVKVVLEKLTEHPTALASQLRMPEASPPAVTTSLVETT